MIRFYCHIAKKSFFVWNSTLNKRISAKEKKGFLQEEVAKNIFFMQFTSSQNRYKMTKRPLTRIFLNTICIKN
ncbi:hypothetical protein PCORN_09532 [Listeria cornellensis FSL F6-0969]|uniref:Uncharacterized protein n=1 Tax=Listeria cornellensis FSL F6-0969 TaxID=1265820 RepID=W7BXM9_9LIST|nr:hypothetical protein PCORN_09532 [Listeria cornellensis FSL F6-0969]